MSQGSHPVSRALVSETAMVDLGDGGEADQVLDGAGEGGGVGHAA